VFNPNIRNRVNFETKDDTRSIATKERQEWM